MTALSHKWLRQVLTDRGVKAPSDAACAAFVESLDPAGHEQARAFLNAVTKGVESTDGMTAFLASINAAHREAAPVATEPLAVRSLPLPSRNSRPVPPATPVKRKAVAAADSAERAALRDQGMHIYAGKAAMKIELDMLRAAEGDPSRLTVQIELAPAVAPRSFDWEQKIPFQFTRRELPLLGAMLMGYAGGSLVLTNHGPDHDKRLELHQQGNVLYVKLRQGIKTLAMPVEAADLFGWVAITITALKNHHQALDSGALFEILKRTGAMHAAASTPKP
ncbi:MAG: hypothetical protein U1E02_16670 [Hydrogenophaga sp.]|nr:hypothetical protein [Hydrogenophaga sp.]